MKKYHILLIALAVLLTIFVIMISNYRINYMKGLIVDIGKGQVFITNEQRKVIQFLDNKIEGITRAKVTISFYHPASRGINSDGNPNRTAIMVRPVVGRTIAISQELFDLGWLGSKVYIDGFGVFYAEDRMGSSIKGKQIDVCVASKKRAFQLGMKYNVTAIRLSI